MTLDRLYADFQVIETHAVIPAVARAVLDRFAGAADGALLRARESLAEISDTHGLYAIFPRGSAWYLHYPSDTPIVYVGGSASLIAFSS
jgi:hypothetical protein